MNGARQALLAQAEGSKLAVGSDNFNGQRMQALVDENLQRIIHKAVLGDACLARKHRAGDSHTEMGAMPLGIGSGMSGMRGAFVEHIELSGLQRRLQCLLDGPGAGELVAHVWVSLSPACRCLAMYKPCTSKNTSGMA